jgi:Mrp family chromosome partitioning ATPase
MVVNEAVETAAPIPVVARDNSQVSSGPAVVPPAPVVAPADMLLNAIVLKRPSRAFRLDRQATDQIVVSKAAVESYQQEPPPPARVVIDTAASEVAATEWELESSRELADSARYGQYAEVLRCIRRDVRSTKTPVIACCSVEADAQTADLVHRVATIAAKGETAKVLIIDANQSASRMTDELDLADVAGFIDALSRGMSVDELVRPTSQPGIFVLPLGDGAIEHLGIARKRLAALVQRWRKEYGLVLMDVGPMSAQLAGLISGGCDGAYVSVQLGTTLAVEAEKRIKQFRTDGVNLLGCIALQPQ